MAFIRFVQATEQENARWATGIVAIAEQLRSDGLLLNYQVEVVQSAFAWFDEHLPCPPFQKNRSEGIWTDDAVAWFLATAKEPIAKMWDLVSVLKEQGVAVRVIRTDEPGEIVYRDAFQVVAESPE